jgi:FkbM family methyltransferase
VTTTSSMPNTQERFYSILDMRSKIVHLMWRLGLTPTEECIRLKDCPVRLYLRRGTHDAHIAKEIFQEGQYLDREHLTRSENIKTIIDVGANVGFSVLYFAHNYPHASIHCYEPVPEHERQIIKHVKINNLVDRVVLHSSAAAVKTGKLCLMEDGAASNVRHSAENGITVSAIDWFESLPQGTLDIVKMDIEGGEIDLLSDPRFETVARRIRLMFLEWHASTSLYDAQAWCRSRLESCGFRVSDGSVQYGNAGILKAINPRMVE